MENILGIDIRDEHAFLNHTIPCPGACKQTPCWYLGPGGTQKSFLLLPPRGPSREGDGTGRYQEQREGAFPCFPNQRGNHIWLEVLSHGGNFHRI